jgi:UDPglucose 6-dehydrogenase
MARISTPNVAIWGLAFRPDTSSINDSPALVLLDALHPFAVRAYDPQLRLENSSHPRMRQTDTALAACVGADVLVIMTPWSEFGTIEPRRLADEMRGRIVIDPFGALDHRKCAAMGFTHYRLGAPAGRDAA